MFFGALGFRAAEIYDALGLGDFRTLGCVRDLRLQALGGSEA